MVIVQEKVSAYIFATNDGVHLGEVQVGADGYLQIFIDLEYFTLEQFKETVSALNGVLDGIRNASL
jgi:hypothetical protein